MTYGPPNQGGYNVAGPQPGYPGQPLPPAPGGVGAKLTAATSSKAEPLTIVGIVIAVLGLLMLIFSIVGPWQTLTFEITGDSEYSESTTGDYQSFGVSGLASVWDVTCSFTAESADKIEECENDWRDGIEDGYRAEGGSSSEGEFSPILGSSAGGWTLGFGIAVVLASMPLIFRRFQGVGAVTATALSLAAAISAIVFAATTGAGVVTEDYIEFLEEEFDGSGLYSFSVNLGWGLIIVLVASILLLVSAITAVVLVFQGRPGVAGAPQGLGGYGQPVAVYEQSGPMYGQSGPQYGYPQPGGSQPVQYGQTQLNPNAGSGGVPPQPGYGTPSQPNQYGQTQYNQYPGQNYQ